MMIALHKLYEVDSIPLREITSFYLDQLVYNSAGECFKCTESQTVNGEDQDNEFIFTELHPSELVPGEYIEHLSEQALQLFWVLSRKARLRNKIE